jgi:4-diphosphocytidyl-2-C-methyl-D-erythritol kinase
LEESIRLRAFAKINLGLKILGQRSDGYHEIRSVYQTISFHDRLTVALLKKKDQSVIVECAHPAIPAGADNLVFRACKLWREARRFRGGIRVSLEKRIPVGSGLGGASSDAAATLLGLERLSGDRLDSKTRFELATRLGSDVPLFLLGGRVLGCGRGEEVYALKELPRRACLVVFPGFSVSTADAYRKAGSRLTRKRKGPSIDSFGVRPRFPLCEWGPAENDFERVVFAQWPELARLKRRLIRAGAEYASLTGSGSAVFALFDSAQQIARASKLVPRGWQAFQTRTLPRAEYWRLLFGAATTREG